MAMGTVPCASDGLCAPASGQLGPQLVPRRSVLYTWESGSGFCASPAPAAPLPPERVYLLLEVRPGGTAHPPGPPGWFLLAGGDSLLLGIPGKSPGDLGPSQGQERALCGCRLGALERDGVKRGHWCSAGTSSWRRAHGGCLAAPGGVGPRRPAVPVVNGAGGAQQWQKDIAGADKTTWFLLDVGHVRL